MAITLKELTKYISHMDLTLVAGHKGLDNTVQWPHIVETEAISHFLTGGEIVITTGSSLLSDDCLFSFVKSVYHRGAAGLILNTGYYIDKIADRIIEFCNQVHFPLFTLPWEVHLSEVMQIFCMVITRADQSMFGITSAFKSLLFSQEYREHAVVLLNENGILTNYHYTACTLQLFFKSIAPQKAYWDNLCFQIQTYLQKNKFKDYSVFRHKLSVIGILWNSNPIQQRRFCDLLTDYLNINLPENAYYYLTFGNSCSDIRKLPKCYEQSVQMQSLLQRGIIDKTVCYYNELGIYKLLLDVNDRSLLEEYCGSTLHILQEYDQNTGHHLYEMLKYYLEHNGSVKETAEHFFVHRNTINYNISKIEELLQINLSDLDARFRLHLAFLIEPLLYTKF